MTILRAALIQLRTPATQAGALAQAAPLVRQAAAQGAQFIATPEASNILQRDRAALFAAVRPLEQDEAVQGLISLARELKVWMLIGSALVKREDGRGTWGRSTIVGPWGDVLAKAPDDEPGVLVADLDLDQVAIARAAIPALANDRAFAAPVAAS